MCDAAPTLATPAGAHPIVPPARQLTGNGMVPAGSPAFAARRSLLSSEAFAARPELAGQCTASLLPGGFWQVQRPCHVSAYREEDGEAPDALTVDVRLAPWLPWLRVPLRRVPPSAYVSRDASGHVRDAGLHDAVRAVTTGPM